MRPSFAQLRFRAVWGFLRASGMLSATWVASAAVPATPWQGMPGAEYREIQVSPGPRTGFTRLPAAQTGIGFSNTLSLRAVAANRLREIGSGVALGDVDGDGWVDVYLCGLEGPNGLYRNLGDWKFADITVAAGVACPGVWSTGAVLADVDGDGDLDLLVNGLGSGTTLFLNDGHGKFAEQRDSGFQRSGGATSLALGDIDGDGDLDVYVAHYRTDTFFDNPKGLRTGTRTLPDGTRVAEPVTRFLTLQGRDQSPTVIERGEPDVLYINRGGGHFEALTWTDGAFLDARGAPLGAEPTDWGLSAMFRDLNGDGRPDLYVCNDFIHWPDRLWWNDQGRRFRAAAPVALRSQSVSSMAIDVADINRDGFDDFFTADMLSPRRAARAWQRPDRLQGVVAWPVEDPEFREEVPRNTLQLARGDGTYADIAVYAGVAATDWTTSVAFLDVDLDGWEDLLLVGGNGHDVQDVDALAQVAAAGPAATPEARQRALALVPERRVASRALRNRHDLSFEDVSAAWGFDQVGVAHGLAFADLDNDGDLDVVVNAMNEPARVYRNESTAARIALRLVGADGNTRGIGARMRVSGGPVVQTQEMMAGGRFASSDDALRCFAAGTAKSLDLRVQWRSGRVSQLRGAQPNRVYRLQETETEPELNPEPDPWAGVKPLFDNVASRWTYRHHDAVDEEFRRYPLLSKKLANLGTGVAVTDWNGDGYEDVVVAGGRGGRLGFGQNDGAGQFREEVPVGLELTNALDQTAVVGWQDGAGQRFLAIGQANWEIPDATAPGVQILRLTRDGVSALALAGVPSGTTGPLALADVDGDGFMDLFVGGRVNSGRYPEAAESHLLRGDGRGFWVDREFQCRGLISGAVFSDIDGDGDPDLVLAEEWGPVRVLRNQHGEFTEATASLGLAELRGWWNGVAAGDFDGDGRMDLVVANWGRNWRPDASGTTPPAVRVYFGEWAEDGVLHALLASADRETGKVLPWRERRAVAAVLPEVTARFPTEHAYGVAGIEEVLGPERMAKTQSREATVLESMVLLNRGDHFEPRPLPPAAQFAPAFGVAVADFDGDGREDVVLAQNFFGMDVESTRQDAGVGLLLRGDGQGNFQAVSPRESGIALYGEQRGVAVGDFDDDGRPDCVVTQHGGEPRILRNVRGRPGVRVSLAGTRGDADVVGASVRLKCGGAWGPAREVHAGSGFGSQDSLRPVLATPRVPEALRVQWPGGETREWPWPKGARRVRVTRTGIEPSGPVRQPATSP